MKLPSSEAPDGRGRSIWQSCGAVLLLTLSTTLAVYWPLPLHLSTHTLQSAFSDAQLGCFDLLARLFERGTPGSSLVSDFGYPYQLDARFMAWVPTLLSLPFRALLGPATAYHLVLLLTPALSALAAFFFLERVGQTQRPVAALCAIVYGLQPFLLSSLSNGQIEKAQLWAYPLHLWLLYEAIRGQRPAAALAALPLVSLALVFTDPYFGLFLPLAAGPLALAWALGASHARARSLVRAGVALLLTASVLVGARAYYQPKSPSSPVSIFRVSGPAPSLEGPLTLYPPPAASPADLIRVAAPRTTHDNPTHHVPYVGIPLFLLAFLCIPMRAPGWPAGLFLGILGVVLALGPRLLIDDYYRTFAGLPYYLPAELLERLGYPLKQGGQYYRAVPLAWLGFLLLLSGGISRLRARQAVLIASIASLGLVGDAVFRADKAIRVPQTPIVGLEVWSSMAAAPGPGALLTLPIEGDATAQGRRLRDAALAQRSTSAVARQVRMEEVTGYLRWLTMWDEARQLGPEQARAALQALGFRYVVGYLGQGFAQPDAHGLDSSTLKRLLGAPERVADLEIWDLGATPLRPQPVAGMGSQNPPR